MALPGVWAYESRVLPSLDSMLAEPWIQTGTLALAAISAMALLHRLKHPVGWATTHENRVSLQPGGTARAVGFSALWLAGYVLCLLFELPSRLMVGLGVVYVLVVLGHVIGGFGDLHLHLSRDWLLPATRSRPRLGRRCAVGLVMRSVVWFPAGASAAFLQRLDAQQDSLLHVLLLVHIAALLLIAFLAGVVRRWPQKTPWPWLVIGVPPYLFLVFVVVVLALLFEHTLKEYALLVGALVASTLFAVFVGGRGLAKAEVVE